LLAVQQLSDEKGLSNEQEKKKKKEQGRCVVFETKFVTHTLLFFFFFYKNINYKQQTSNLGRPANYDGIK